MDPEPLVAALRAAGCVFAEEEAAVLLAAAGDDPSTLAGLVARRIAGEPLEVVVGWAEFAGRRILIDPGVFVPRRRTELMVRLAAGFLRAAQRERRRNPRIVADPAILVDLCCGSGAVAVAVLVAVAADLRTVADSSPPNSSGVPEIVWYACDLEPAAVACARRNVEPLGGTVCSGDLFAALPPDVRGRLAVVTANAPYVPTAEVAMMPPEARLHEPLITLDGGADGLDVQRRIIAAAPRWLRPGGRLLVESSREQAATSVALMSAAGLVPSVHTDKKVAGTVVVGELPT